MESRATVFPLSVLEGVISITKLQGLLTVARGHWHVVIVLKTRTCGNQGSRLLRWYVYLRSAGFRAQLLLRRVLHLHLISKNRRVRHASSEPKAVPMVRAVLRLVVPPQLVVGIRCQPQTLPQTELGWVWTLLSVGMLPRSSHESLTELSLFFIVFHKLL